MNEPVSGIHHVTATVDAAQPDYDFFAGWLGLRLVKTTVNFDNSSVYHFYYGDEHGTPGTIMTTFPYRGKGVRVGIQGAGQITVTSFSVPLGALDGWRRRARGHGLETTDEEGPFGPALRLHDPSGLALRLVETDGDRRRPWASPGIDPAIAVRGLDSVTLTVRDPAPTVAFLQEALGFEVVAGNGRATRLGVSGGGSGREVEVVAAGPGAADAVNGLGTVHHVAFAIATAEEQLTLRAALLDRGCRVTEVRDRNYFRSIYFREPGGVLYEVATTGPGFAVDEPVERLGETLRLPPWEEARRAEIEAGLPPLERR